MSWMEFGREIETRMTPELAARVRELRCGGDRKSWRGVSRAVFDFSESEILSDYAEMRGEQPLGMFLCEAAARALGEDPNKEPWN